MKKSIRIVLVVFLAVLTLTIGTGIIAVQTNKIPSSGYPNLGLAAILNQNQATAYNSENTANPNSPTPLGTTNPNSLILNQTTTKEVVQAQIDDDFRTWVLSSKERMLSVANANNETITALFTQFLSENSKDLNLFKQYDQLLRNEVVANLSKLSNETNYYMDLIISEGKVVNEWNITKTVNGTTCIEVIQDYALDINGTTQHTLKVSLYDLNGTLISDPLIRVDVVLLFFTMPFFGVQFYGYLFFCWVRFLPQEAPFYIQCAEQILYASEVNLYNHLQQVGAICNAIELMLMFADIGLAAGFGLAKTIEESVHIITTLSIVYGEELSLLIGDHYYQLADNLNYETALAWAEIQGTWMYNQNRNPDFGFEICTVASICMWPCMQLRPEFSYLMDFVITCDGLAIPICPILCSTPIGDPNLCWLLLLYMFWYSWNVGFYRWAGWDIPPVGITLSGTPGNNGWYTSSVTANVTNASSDVSTMEYSCNGLDWNPCNGPLTISSDGVHILYYKSSDSAGNVNASYEVVKIDTVAPMTTLIATSSLSGKPGINVGTNYVMFNSNVAVTLKATDSTSGVNAMWYCLNDTNNWTLYNGKPFTISSEGVTTIYYNSTDNAGNVENTHNVTVMIDKTPPVTSISLNGTQGSNGVYNSSVTATLTANDSVSKAYVVSGVKSTAYSFDGVTWNNYNGPFNVSGTGSVIVYYNSTDNAGNVENTKTITIIKTLTSISLNGTQESNGWYTSNVAVTLNATHSVSWSPPLIWPWWIPLVNPSGISKIAYSFDGTHWTNYTVKPTVSYTWVYYIPGGWNLVPVYNYPTNYSISFTISNEGKTTLYYTAADGSGNWDPTSNATIIIDKNPPVTTISLNGTQESNGWYTSNVNVTLTANDNVSGVAAMSYSLNDTNHWALYTSPFTVPAEGVTTIYYNSTDNAGNMENTSNRTVMIDKTPPVTTNSLNGTQGLNGWYTSNVNVTLTANDNVSGVAAMSYSLNDTNHWALYTSPFTISAEGTTTIYYRSIDSAGNVENTETVTVMIDKTPPVTSISLNGTQGLNGWYTSNVNVTLTATAGVSGVAVMEYSFDGINWVNFNGSLTVSTNQSIYWPFLTPTNQTTCTNPLAISTTISNEGATILYYRSINFAGNIGNTSIAIIMVDKNPPVTTINLNGVQSPNGCYASDVIVTLNAADTAAAASNILNLNIILNTTNTASATNSGIPIITGYSLDGNGWVTYASPFTISTNGIHTLAYASIDDAGNVENISTVTINVQKAPLVTSISLNGTQGLNGWYTSDVNVTLNATDTASGVWITGYSLDGNGWVTYNGPFTISAEGITTLYYNSTDNAGNVENTNTLTVMVDMTPPVTSISLNGTMGLNEWYTSDVIVTLNATDTVSGVWITGYSLDGNGWVPYNGPFTISAEGVYTLSYASIDSAGNYNISTVTVMIDKTFPVTILTIGMPSAVIGSNVIVTSTTGFTLTATDSISGVAHTYYRINGGSWIEYNGTFNITGPTGNYTLDYYSVDTAGNQGLLNSQTVGLLS